MLNFHTNSARTANGFHLTINQIDCISGGRIHPAPSPSTQGQGTKPQPSQLPAPPSHFIRQQEILKYDDDEIASEFDHPKKTTISKTTPIVMTSTTQSFSPPTRRPSKLDIDSHVIYEQTATTHDTKGVMPSATKGTGSTPSSPGSTTYPLRYFSRNITVLNGDSSNTDATNTDGSRTIPAAPGSRDRFEQQRFEG